MEGRISFTTTEFLLPRADASEMSRGLARLSRQRQIYGDAHPHIWYVYLSNPNIEHLLLLLLLIIMIIIRRRRRSIIIIIIITITIMIIIMNK